MRSARRLPLYRAAAALAVAALALWPAQRADAAYPDINVTGSWSETINASDLMAGAGSNLNGTYTSSASAAVVYISNTPDWNEPWRVDVRRVDTNWHGNFTLNTRRTSSGYNASGAGGNYISGGTTYRAITTTNALFFWGAYDRSDIDIQFQLTGMSVSIPPATYTTTVVFTATLN